MPQATLRTAPTGPSQCYVSKLNARSSRKLNGLRRSNFELMQRLVGITVAVSVPLILIALFVNQVSDFLLGLFRKTTPGELQPGGSSPSRPESNNGKDAVGQPSGFERRNTGGSGASNVGTLRSVHESLRRRRDRDVGDRDASMQV